MTLAARTLAELRAVTRDLQTTWDRVRLRLGAAPRVVAGAPPERLPVLRVGSDARAIVIGRSRSSDIVFEQDSVSRSHALLTCARDGWRLQDMDSTNGTHVNGRRICGPTPVRSGDRIGLGELLLELELS